MRRRHGSAAKRRCTAPSSEERGPAPRRRSSPLLRHGHRARRRRADHMARRDAPERRDRERHGARRCDRVAAEQRAAEGVASSPSAVANGSSHAAIGGGSASVSRNPAGIAPLAARSRDSRAAPCARSLPADRRQEVDAVDEGVRRHHHVVAGALKPRHRRRDRPPPGRSPAARNSGRSARPRRMDDGRSVMPSRSVMQVRRHASERSNPSWPRHERWIACVAYAPRNDEDPSPRANSSARHRRANWSSTALTMPVSSARERRGRPRHIPRSPRGRARPYGTCSS